MSRYALASSVASSCDTTHTHTHTHTQNEKVIRDKTDELKEERQRADELSRKLCDAKDRIDDLDRELARARRGSSSGGSTAATAELERRLRSETDARVEAERMVSQFKEAKERNEVCMRPVAAMCFVSHPLVPALSLSPHTEAADGPVRRKAEA